MRQSNLNSGQNVSRLRQAVLIVATLLSSWLAMQAVHEFGHVLGAWISGARVVRVVLYPLTISRTDIGLNPHPLLVVWAGPVIGILLPLAGWAIAARLRFRGSFLLRFFAGFCCIANGLYIGLGSFGAIGDCGEMLRHGTSRWQLWLFGAIVPPLGFLLWHRQGIHFGLGHDAAEISTRQALITCSLCVALILFGFVVDGN
jgi:hypothetical protein